jgi:hypothetical protein
MKNDNTTQTQIALTQEELTLRDIIAQNQFSETKALLGQEMQEVDELFSTVKELLMEEVNAGKASPTDRPMRLGTAAPPKKRNMMFISSQTTNLISIKNLKMSLINKTSALQADMLDRNIRTLTQISKDNKGEGEGIGGGAILDFLINNLNINIPVSPKMRSDFNLAPANSADVEDDLDAIIDAAEREKEAPKPETPQVDFTAPPPTAKKKKVVEVEEPVYTKEYKGQENRFLVYNEATGEMCVVDDGYDPIEDLNEDEYDIEELEDGTIVDKLTNTIIEVLGE